MEAGSRVPPHNLEAESSVLGSILLDNEVLSGLSELRPEMFYRESHRKIFAAVQGLSERGEPVDLVTLVDELRARKQLEDVGGIAYLAGLPDMVPTALYAEAYLRILQEKYTLRQLITASGQVMQLAYNAEGALEDLLDKSQKLIFDIGQGRGTEEFQAINNVVHETFEYITQMHATGGIGVGVPTGFKDLDDQTTGLQPGSLNVLAARPSMGKCLTAHTLIDLPGTGERITIEEFVRRRSSCVFGISERGTVRRTRVSDWIDSGVKPVWRVTTRTGRQVEVTGHHPFLTPQGWTPLHDLKVGDAIAVPRAVPCFGQDDSVSLERIKLLAYFIAEGGLTQSSPRWTNTDPVLIADFTRSIQNEFPDLELHQDGIDYRISRTVKPGERKDRPNPLTTWLRELGLWGQHAEHKRFPDAVWTWTRERLALFLRVLLSCDGTIYPLGVGRRARIEFTVASEGLARDVQHLLTRFGILAKLWRKTERSWRVEITESRSVDLYQREIGWLGEKAQRDYPSNPLARVNIGQVPATVWNILREKCAARGWSLSELARRAGEHTPEGYNPHTSRGITPARLRRYAEVLEDENLARLSSEDLHWDQIIRVEPLGEVQVYDLTVPDGANFIAQDICVHNTALALAIGQNVCMRGNPTVAVFSLEMPSIQLVLRMLCSEARVDMNRVRQGQLNDRDFERLAAAAGRLADAPMVIDDDANLTLNELRSKCRRILAQQGSLGLVIIDYLQLMSGSKNSGGGENRQQEISNISRGLKSIARELSVPVLVLSQLSRAVESRPNHRPMLSDLRESGAIEQDADLVMFIYRDEYYNKETDQQGIAEIIIGKQRNGPVGTIKLQFNSANVSFNNLAAETYSS